MADFDSFDYSIEKRLPEWWKGFGALEPLNKYTQDLIAKILEKLLGVMGVVQPLNCWLTIPEEYTWYHHYKPTDDMLKDENGDTIIDNAVTKLFAGSKIHAQVPNTKRNCHAKIRLKLLGRDIENKPKNSEIIEELVIQNAEQKIILNNIPTTSTIEISTKDNEILIDGVENTDLIDGKINKIKPTIKNENYKVLDIDKNGQIQEDDDGNPKYKNIEVDDENKKTEIILQSSKTVNFDLQVYLYKPTYTTEQNIKITTVSAFPIEWVRLYGYFCHPFNNNVGYKFLWEKKYSKESRTVFDRITKQYDCERFCIQVKFHGIGTPLVKGFPQEYGTSSPAYTPNENLDKWGKIYGLPRRAYKPDITEDEEPFTFPKYYKYPIEQDYWYEERMINEYKFEEDSVNSLFVRDDEFNNIGLLECIYPFMDDIWVYTETVDPKTDKIYKVQNEERDDIPVHEIIEDKESYGKEWDNPQALIEAPISIKLNPKSNDVIKLNDFSYQSKILKLSFDLTPFDEATPKNITIKGIELKFKTRTELQSKTIKLSDESKVYIPYPNPNPKDINNYIIEKINIIQDNETWVKQKGYYTIGGENYIFQEEEITREQLFNGNDGKLEFELRFINDNNFLKNILYLENATLNIYYEIIQNEYSIDVEFDKKEINLKNNDNHIINMKINIKNTGKIEVNGKEVLIIIPPELTLRSEYNSYLFNLAIGEVCEPIDVLIEPTVFDDGIRTGLYDVLVICEDKVISNEILIRGKES